jgi:Bifunctional DNA primase/polymerase, N-terminal
VLIEALRYASQGWQIFPVTPGNKIPLKELTPHGCKDASSEERVIRSWWRRVPRANIAVACGSGSGIVVLDYDVKAGKKGLQTLASLCSRFQIRTLTQATPSGGRHQVFQYPGPVLRNAVDRLPGLDIRTDGGYVVVAPSVVDGKPYRWLNREAVAEMPPGLLAILRRQSDPQPIPLRPRSWPTSRLWLIERARRYVEATPGAVEGEAGDVTTFKLACRLVRGFAFSDDEALMLLWTWNLKCRPPWSQQDLLSKIRSARTNGCEPIGGRLEVCRS